MSVRIPTELGRGLNFDMLLRPGVLVPAYQPLVELATGDVVGFEALARWPGVPGADPGTVFAAAYAAERVTELDSACRVAAIGGAVSAGLSGGQALFVNVEVAALGSEAPAGADQVLNSAGVNGMRIVLELTERAMMNRPAEVLQFVRWARERGFGIALDDVGAEPDSLALLPLVEPDVIKLDLALIQNTPSMDQARTMAAVLAHAESRDTAILAEGIETPEHVERALTFGARYGQGWLYGRPGRITPGSIDRPIRFTERQPVPAHTPYTLVADRDDLRVGRKSVILAMSQHLENQGRSQHDPPVVLATFQHAKRFTPTTARRYSALAATCPLVAALASKLPPHPAPGVRGVALSAGDPLVQEWTIVVIGAHYAAALIARDLGDDLPDADRRFRFLITHDRDLVITAGRSLMSRVLPT